MSCGDFEQTAREAARTGRLAPEEERHVAACPACAARLERERSLTLMLSALAASTAGEEAPARVEQALRKAFRRRRKQAAVRAWQGWRLWAPAMAATAALAVMAVLLRQPAAPDPVRAPAAPAAIEAGRAGGWPVPASQAAAAADAVPEAGQGPSAARGSAPLVSAPVRTVRSANRAATVRAAAPAQMPPPAAKEEIATEFLPLRLGEPVRPGEFAQVVRVTVPRSAMVSLGVPVLPEVTPRAVLADVVLGEDGTARAIRFVKY